MDPQTIPLLPRPPHEGPEDALPLLVPLAGADGDTVAAPRPPREGPEGARPLLPFLQALKSALDQNRRHADNALIAAE